MEGIVTVLGSFAWLIVAPIQASAHDLVLTDAPVQVYFSPQGGGADAIVREINRAGREVLVQAYALSAQPIVKALLGAKARGVTVQVVLDRSEVIEGLSPAVVLSGAGVPVYMDGKHGLAHSHVIIIDRRTVVTGSYSFTRAAEDQNAENLLVLTSQPLAELYRKNWEEHRAHALRE